MPRRPRNRSLTEDDRAVWGRVVDTARPLHPPARHVQIPELPASPAAPAPLLRPERPKRILRPISPASGPRITHDLAPDSFTELGAARAIMDSQRLRDLKRGKLKPEARIDLHGMTAARAHDALIAFITRARADGLRLVLVITGKGRSSDREEDPRRMGVLRHAVPHWLGTAALASHVLQVVPASGRHGGGGALYVYLRRQR